MHVRFIFFRLCSSVYCVSRGRSSWTQFLCHIFANRGVQNDNNWESVCECARQNGSRCSKYSHCVFLLFAIYLRWNINEAPPTSLYSHCHIVLHSTFLCCFLFFFFLFEINDPIKRRLHEIGCLLCAIIIWLFTCRNLWRFCKALDTLFDVFQLTSNI